MAYTDLFKVIWLIYVKKMSVFHSLLLLVMMYINKLEMLLIFQVFNGKFKECVQKLSNESRNKINEILMTIKYSHIFGTHVH